MGNFHSLISIVIITYNRLDELLRTLGQLTKLREEPRIIVVDNGSSDGTADEVERLHPEVTIIRAPQNLGAAGRTLGVQMATTPYIAFCDDDTWWEDGCLERACHLLNTYGTVAILTARVLVGSVRREDPVCQILARSPLSSPSLPGVALVGFLAGASVVRRSAFLDAGGFHPRLFIGGEEGLLALDLMVKGWDICYVPELTVLHHPSPLRDKTTRSIHLIRNEIWLAWLRRPMALALQKSWRLAKEARHDRCSREALWSACRGLPWVLARRKALPHHIEQSLRLVEATEQAYVL